MDFYFIFCADGILRMQYAGQPIAIPVKFVQEVEEIKDDYKFWFNWWKKDVVFEKNLTFGKFLECLSPWEEFWSKYSGINIGAYLKEGHKLSLVSEPVPFDWILCRCYKSINALTISEPGISMAERLKPSYSPKLKDQWYISSRLVLSGYRMDEDDHYNVAGYPINVIYNVPLYLNAVDIVEIQDHPYFKPELTDNIVSIFNHDGFGIRHIDNFRYFESPSEHTLCSLMGSIFSDFELTPTERDVANEELTIQLNEAMAEVEESIQEKGMPDESTIHVASSALQGVQVEMQAEQNYWKRITELAKKSNTEPLKIGKIEPGEEPVQYVYCYKIEQNGDLDG